MQKKDATKNMKSPHKSDAKKEWEKSTQKRKKL
jgi:hypothetical protein